MKARILLLILLSVALFILVNKDSHKIRTFVLNLVTPVKTDYKDLTRTIRSKGQSYIFQKETIQRLTKENRVLRKYLLDQTHYLRQVGRIYKLLPTLEKLPYKSIVLVDTVSYVKLNKFDEVLLTVPKHVTLQEGKPYGLVQGDVVAGIAQLEGGLLYGYLISNPKARFSVYVGPKRFPGIAQGVDKNLIKVRYIPKWAKIHEGDLVETSGLDGIFFAYLPVGKVIKILTEGGYKSAYVQTYADTLHPGIFFLITDARPYVASYYDQNRSFPNRAYPYASEPPLEQNESNITSIPQIIQTKDLEVDPSEFIIPVEKEPAHTHTTHRTHKRTEPKAKSTQTQPQTTPAPNEKNAHPQNGAKKADTKPNDNVKHKPRQNVHPSPFDILREPRF